MWTASFLPEAREDERVKALLLFVAVMLLAAACGDTAPPTAPIPTLTPRPPSDAHGVMNSNDLTPNPDRTPPRGVVK